MPRSVAWLKSELLHRALEAEASLATKTGSLDVSFTSPTLYGKCIFYVGTRVLAMLLLRRLSAQALAWARACKRTSLDTCEVVSFTLLEDARPTSRCSRASLLGQHPSTAGSTGRQPIRPLVDPAVTANHPHIQDKR